MRRTIILFTFLAAVAIANGQSLLGTTGWLNIPSAEMQEDGTFFLGSSFVNQNYIESYGGGNYNVLTYYFNITFLPFIEVNFGSSHLLDYHESNHTVDRRFSFRLRLLRERKYVPAIVVGARDVYSSIAREAYSNQYFSTLFVVATKHIPVKRSEFGINLGYGINAFRNDQFLGFFGGVSFSPSFLRQMNVFALYDTKGFNFGANMLFFKHLFIYAMAQEFQYFSGGIAYRVYLLNKAKQKQKNKNRRKP